MRSIWFDIYEVKNGRENNDDETEIGELKAYYTKGLEEI